MRWPGRMSASSGRSSVLGAASLTLKRSPGPAWVMPLSVATVSKFAWSPRPNTLSCKGVGQSLQGMAPQHDVTGAGQQLPAAVGLVSPPAAAAVSPGVSVPAVEAMPMATAGARSMRGSVFLGLVRSWSGLAPVNRDFRPTSGLPISPSVGHCDGVGRIQGGYGPFPFLAATAGARWFLGHQPLAHLWNDVCYLQHGVAVTMPGGVVPRRGR